MTSRSKSLRSQAPNETPLPGSEVREFVELVQQVAQRHSPHSVFADFCEISAIALSNVVDMKQRDVREARYLDLVKRYDRDELTLIARMLGIVSSALDNSPQDFLGKCFESLGLGGHWKRQFFTPYELCVFNAEMIGSDLTEATIINAGGFVSVSDPACGSGAMLIAFADMLGMKGLDYQKVLHATAQDIDATAAYMCYVQLSLMHVPAIVLVGDSLALEVRERWVTAAHVIGRWNQRLLERAGGDQARESSKRKTIP